MAKEDIIEFKLLFSLFPITQTRAIELLFIVSLVKENSSSLKNTLIPSPKQKEANDDQLVSDVSRRAI
ncbi:hypothetical protein Gasu2_08150 [Galdieria sulphuraria]|nr:hypothetical protein Gasu2_08150 [Galdieria sulphuraria]